MANNYGPGVSRVLNPAQTGYKLVLWQQDRPPCDSELSLIGDIAGEWDRLIVLKGTPSGWYGDAINPQDSFVTNPNWSNWYKFGSQFSGEKNAVPWAVVNGWVVPVTGTLTGTPPGSPNNSDTWNRVTLPPPPANTGDARIDFVFLEVWLARIPPTPATTNKPAAAAVWRYGNVEGGYSFIADDLQDPAIGFETTQRIQLQYRIRVVSGLVGLASYPDGFDPSVVKGQGTASAATSFVFENMRQELGDPGLWRAGDGTANSLGTVDGYTYAIPISATFRRNSVAWDGSPGQNLNGGVNRNPTAVDRTGYKTFSTVPTLAAGISASAGTLTLASATNIPLPLTPASPVAIKVGDEVMYYSSITGTTMTLSSRGVFGTLAETHPSGATITVVSGRPDGLYSDQIAKTDILDLRHMVNPGGFDYQALLKGGLDRLMRGQLGATWKRTGAGPQGRFVTYGDVITAGAVPLGITKLDNPDDLRSVFCNPVTMQPMVIPVPTPPSGTTTVTVSLGGSYQIVMVTNTGSAYTIGDSWTIPKAQFLNSLPGSDSDQITLIADQTYVKVRFQGETSDLASNQYTVANNGSGDLVVTLTASFVAGTRAAAKAFLTMHVLYGAGRGLSRKPDVIHSVAYLSNSSEIMVASQGVPSGNAKLRTAWAPLWSKFRSGMFNGQLPTTAEAYVDPGSGSVILTPFRRHQISSANTFKLVAVQKASPGTANLGAMPSQTPAGGAKWTTTDPLQAFRSYAYGSDASRVVTIPRKLAPAWGAVKVPILYQDQTNFDEGVNYMISSPKGASPGQGVVTYSPTVFSGGSNTFGVFSTRNLNLPSPTSATYNAAATFGGVRYAGMRFFTDSRGLNRVGLEMPPFYGISRLFSVYEAQDYIDNGSAYNASDRERDTGPGTRATNLLRSDFTGDTFWVEVDSDGDATFILNADALDLSKSPNAISAFANGHYVIETSIWGFDRSFFDLTQDARMVVTRETSVSTATQMALDNPTFVLPGAPAVGDDIEINYSREPYQGDAWGSQLTQSDLGYAPGALTTSTRYQLMTTTLDYEDLERPNEKVLEVLAGMAFQTTLGTGHFSGDVPSTDADFRVVGYEPWTVPTSPTDDRPTVTRTALASAERALSIGTEYLGATARLPLGALFRDKDFRGNAVGGPTGDLRHLLSGVWYSPATIASNVAPSGNTEFGVDPVHNPSMVSGNAGEVVAHVDGEQGNYSGLTTYRTARGGSAFSLSGLPGGDVAAVLPQSGAASTAGGILSGVAMLVRNTPTAIGATEVSAGQELMLLVVTTARTQGASSTINTVQCGPAGTGEGYSAADLYRLPGHPICNDSARPTVDPSSVLVARKSDLLTGS